MMELDFLTDDSDKSLAPFFSPRILFASYGIVVIVGILLLLVWPRKPSLDFISVNSIPKHFFLITAASLILHAYVSLHCGRGEMAKRDYLDRFDRKEVPLEKKRNFFTYGMITFLAHSLFLLFPFLPLFFLSASISGISLVDTAGAILIIFTASLLCRMFGFTTYLIWGWWKVTGYLIGIALAIYFILISAILTPEINPILLLYKLNTSVGGSGFFFTDEYQWYMRMMVSGIIFFVLVNYFLIRRHMKKEKVL